MRKLQTGSTRGWTNMRSMLLVALAILTLGAAPATQPAIVVPPEIPIGSPGELQKLREQNTYLRSLVAWVLKRQAKANAAAAQSIATIASRPAEAKIDHSNDNAAPAADTQATERKVFLSAREFSSLPKGRGSVCGRWSR